MFNPTVFNPTARMPLPVDQSSHSFPWRAVSFGLQPHSRTSGDSKKATDAVLHLISGKMMTRANTAAAFHLFTSSPRACNHLFGVYTSSLSEPFPNSSAPNLACFLDRIRTIQPFIACTDSKSQLVVLLMMQPSWHSMIDWGFLVLGGGPWSWEHYEGGWRWHPFRYTRAQELSLYGLRDQAHRALARSKLLTIQSAVELHSGWGKASQCGSINGNHLVRWNFTFQLSSPSFFWSFLHTIYLLLSFFTSASERQIR